MSKEKYRFRAAEERAVYALRTRLKMPGLLLLLIGVVLFIAGISSKNTLLANFGSLTAGLGIMAVGILLYGRRLFRK